MSKRIRCKFFAHGSCLKGERCEFSHNWKDPPKNICLYYQRGICSFGSRCRYEHVKASQSYVPASSSSAVPRQSHISDSSKIPCSSKAVPTLVKPARYLKSAHHDPSSTVDSVEPRSVEPVEHSICSYATDGNCPRGDKCPHIHGDLCPTCGKHCLHPFRPKEREEHIKMCVKKKKDLETLKRSEEIECSVCLDRVLSKATAAERKFGLLSECDHPFCISCIRNWRNSSPSSGVDVNSALRACPICRKVSYFVIPSVSWYCTPEDKKEIVDSYKAKLRSINCKHFKFGNGNCPFGTSCFYKHTVKPGSYVWKYHRPPPRRPNVMDMDSIFDVLEDLIAEAAEMDTFVFDNLGAEVYDELDNLTPMEMALLLARLGYDYSSEEDDYLF